MSVSTRPSLNKPAALLAIVVGVGAGSYGVASAASGSGSATTTTTATAAAGTPSAPPGASAQNPWGTQRSDETLLTGDALAKVQAIAEAKVPGGTIVRIETDADGVAAYTRPRQKGRGGRGKGDSRYAFWVCKPPVRSQGETRPGGGGGQPGPPLTQNPSRQATLHTGSPTPRGRGHNLINQQLIETNTTTTRILVVDDEPSIVDAVATALRYEGFDVEEATTGRDALSAVARFEPDLVVLDWMLPDIEGIEVGRRLRDQGFKTAILFLTAKDAVENKVEALRAGGDDYVTKPFSLAEIVARVQAILRRTGGDLPGDVLRFADLVLDEEPARGASAARRSSS